MINDLPDISENLNAPPYSSCLDWVGMENIALPVYIENTLCPSQVNAFVSLDDPTVKGIHMSRLYIRLLELAKLKTLNTSHLKDTLQDFLKSHEGLSNNAKLHIKSQLYVERPALISPLTGWKSYPFELVCQLIDHQFFFEVQVEIPYSSTCPCSAALSRSLIQQQFQKALSEGRFDLNNSAKVIDWLGTTEAIVATPHSQRSVAQLQFKLSADIAELPLIALIDQAEHAIATPVQTAVKRVDEQAFALANGQNLMFCEDAVRRLHHTFLDYTNILGFKFKVIHAESLHAHDAVAEGSWQW